MERRSSSKMMFFCIFLIVLIVHSCTKKETIKTQLFTTKGLQVGIKEAENQGFSLLLGIDVYFLHKKVNDTLIMLGVDPTYDVIHSKTWRVKIKSTKVAYLEKFFKQRDCKLSESFYKNLPTNYWCKFYAFNEVDNVTYVCSLYDEEDEYYIDICYYVPLLHEGKIAHKISKYKGRKK